MRISEATLRVLAETDDAAYHLLNVEYKALLLKTSPLYHVRVWIQGSTLQTALHLREYQ